MVTVQGKISFSGKVYDYRFKVTVKVEVKVSVTAQSSLPGA